MAVIDRFHCTLESRNLLNKMFLESIRRKLRSSKLKHYMVYTAKNNLRWAALKPEFDPHFNAKQKI